MNIGDAALLMSIYWLNPQRMRGVTTVLFIILALFLYANVLYARYWGDLIPFAVIFSKASYNSLVLQSISSLFWKRDIIYIIATVVVILLWRKNRGGYIMPSTPASQHVLLPFQQHLFFTSDA
jgi:hypothetical protein